MKKFFVCFICALCMCSVFAAGENVATSKAFVDTAVAQKQDKIPANSGTAQVLTNTGTAGTVGTKDIYDSSASYANQTDALVTAGDMNAAVQNAIEAEFYCIKWVDDDPTKDCLLVQIRQPVLSNGYTPVEYLQGNNSGTINTGVVFNSGTLKYSIEVLVDSLVGDTTNAHTGESDVIGNFTDNNVNAGFVAGVFCGGLDGYNCNENHSAFFNYVDPLSLRAYNKANNQWHTMETEFVNNTMIFSVDGSVQSIARNRYLNFSPIVLMGGSNNYMLATNHVKIRNIKIWRDGVMVRDYITARNSENAFGVYDLINNTFTATTNGTALTGGPDMSNGLYLPSGN